MAINKGYKIMKNYRIQKEVNHIQNDNQCFYFEAKSIEDIKEYLISNNKEFIRYSQFSDTVYYKDKK